MASYVSNQFISHPDLGEFAWVGGLILTDSSGVVTNHADGSVLDQDGNPLTFPTGVLSVAKSANAGDCAGTYTIVLDDQWYKCLDIRAQPVQPLLQATVVGTVDITAAVLTTLAGQTLQTDADVGANYTTTFDTPTLSAQAAADKINAGNGGTSVYADIVTTATGASRLRVRSTTSGPLSTLAINAASTGDGTLGMSNVTQTGTTPGYMVVRDWNPKGIGAVSGFSAPAALTVDVVNVVAGVGTALPSAGFYLSLLLKNNNVGWGS